ncbi:MAG: type II toxin-antitoxin system Phd/YefM family antitoxin [Vicinamibacterales bacterium]
MMYNVHEMKKRYTVAQARERLASALDEAERGVPVIIERRGVRYRLSLVSEAKPRRGKRIARIEVVDPSIDAGEWSWNWSGRALTFRPRRQR